MSKDLTKLHYQMLRKTTSGETIDEALIQLKSKVVGNSVQPGEPVVIFYDDTSGNTGAHLAVPTSGITAGDEEGYMFPNRREVFERMEEDEEVTTAALIDLDDRINTVSGDVVTLRQDFDNMGDTFAEIKLTETVKATGVSAGAINNTDVVESGTTFTDFVKQLLIKELDYAVTNPSIAWSSNASAPSGTIEVGSDAVFTLEVTKTQGKFTGSADNGFNPTEKSAGDNFTGTTTYNIYSGTTGTPGTIAGSVSSNAQTGYTISNIQEGKYRVKGTHSYSGVTASGMSLTTNTGANPSSAKIDAGTVGTTDKSFEVAYKIYYGTTSATTTDDFNFPTNVVGTANSTWTNGTKTWTSWENTNTVDDNYYNFFILVPPGYKIDKVYSDQSPNPIEDVFYPGNVVNEANVPTKSISIGGTGHSATYKLYYYRVFGGAKTHLKSVSIIKA